MSKKKNKKKSYRRKTKRSKNRSSSSPLWNVFKLLLLLAGVAFIIYHFFFRPMETGPDVSTNPVQSEDIRPAERKIDVSSLSDPERIRYAIRELFNKYEFREDWISSNTEVTTARMPQDIPSIVFVRDVMNEMDDLDYTIINSTENLSAQKSTVRIGEKGEVLHTLILKNDASIKKFKGKIAIVIDDFGYSENESINRILNAPFPLTIAILPGLAKSEALYQKANEAGKETIVHLPMEALEDKVEYTDYTLYSNMTEEEIRQRVRKAIIDFPAAKGINNHMGSSVTQNEQIMKTVCDELKKNNFYFIDSKTTTESVAFATARKLRLPSIENNIFLERDRNDNEEYLQKKLTALSKIAEKRGYALAIGHPYENTIDVLLKMVPQMENDGFDFVPVSELIYSTD
ncbi:hypothetical protein GF337_04325 [candidate division KSB1 bacterium]|nr:hypothetical protein [candidate division KSB1 bacterium]